MISKNPKPERRALIESLRALGPRLASSMAFLHHAIADAEGIHVTDLRCIEILLTAPLTAGEIAERTGLTTGAVTRLIDRLEKSGFVQRERKSGDRRQVHVKIVPDRIAQLAPRYDGIEQIWEDLIHQRNDAQLAIVRDFIEALDSRLQAETCRVRES